MYNRYIPQPDGSHRRNPTPEPLRQQKNRQPPPAAAPVPCPQEPQPPKKPDRQPPQKADSITGFFKQLLPRDFDTGDLIVVLLLLLMAGDCPEEQNTALLTLVLYLFL